MGSVSLLLPLAVLLVLAKIAGGMSMRLGQPSVVGKLLLGVLVGPSVLGFFTPVEPLTSVATVGVILLMFMAGVETDLVQMRKVGLTAFLVAVGGMLVPLGVGSVFAHAWGHSWTASIFLGVVLTATSVSVTAQTLKELGKLHTRAGSVILGAAVIDDVLGIVLLSVVFGLAGGENPVRPIMQMIAFFVGALVLGQWGLPRLFVHLSKLQSREVSLALVLAMTIIAAWAAEELGKVAAITGAYLFGIALARHPAAERARITYGVDLVGYGFFIPIFFVMVGIEAKLGALVAAPLFTLLLILVAIGTKASGAFVGGVIGRLPVRESVTVGIGMVTRGEVALVVATLGKQSGILDGPLFAASLAMVLATTIATPVLLRLLTAPVSVPSLTPHYATTTVQADAGD